MLSDKAGYIHCVWDAPSDNPNLFALSATAAFNLNLDLTLLGLWNMTTYCMNFKIICQDVNQK